MSDYSIFLLMIVAALGLSYVWLRGWWFAGVVVALASVGAGFHSWGWLAVPAGAALGFAPWVGRWSFTPAGTRFWAEVSADPKQSRPALPNMRPHL